MSPFLDVHPLEAAAAARLRARCALCTMPPKPNPGDPASLAPWVRARRGHMVYTAHRSCWLAAGFPAGADLEATA